MNKKIWIVVAVIVLLICIVFEMYNFNLKKNKIARLEEKVEALTTDDGFVTTKNHLAQMSDVEQQAYEQGKTDGYEEAKSSINNVIDLGTGTSFEVSNYYSDYGSLTKDNFIVELTSASIGLSYNQHYATNTSNSFKCSITKNYNSTTGKLSAYANVSASASWAQQGDGTGTSASNSGTAKVHAYLILK